MAPPLAGRTHYTWPTHHRHFLHIMFSEHSLTGNDAELVTREGIGREMPSKILAGDPNRNRTMTYRLRDEWLHRHYKTRSRAWERRIDRAVYTGVDLTENTWARAKVLDCMNRLNVMSRGPADATHEKRHPGHGTAAQWRTAASVPAGQVPPPTVVPPHPVPEQRILSPDMPLPSTQINTGPAPPQGLQTTAVPSAPALAAPSSSETTSSNAGVRNTSSSDAATTQQGTTRLMLKVKSGTISNVPTGSCSTDRRPSPPTPKSTAKKRMLRRTSDQNLASPASSSNESSSTPSDEPPERASSSEDDSQDIKPTEKNYRRRAKE